MQFSKESKYIGKYLHEIRKEPDNFLAIPAWPKISCEKGLDWSNLTKNEGRWNECDRLYHGAVE